MPELAAVEPSALRNYSNAVAAGAYERPAGGLFGKHDNVRRYWEDQINRYALQDSLAHLVERRRRDLSRIRVLDLGCGAGEGYEILTSVRREGLSLAPGEIEVMPEYLLGLYRGVDISRAMVEKSREVYCGNPKLQFEVADLNEGLPVTADEAPYDIYFSSFGSLSHLDDEAVARLLDGICRHMGESAIFVADLVGQYSYEWQQYWDDPDDDGTNLRGYSMSYIYPPEVVDQLDVETFPLRFWGGRELAEFVAGVVGRHGVSVANSRIRDRSVLVGRHMDTAEFNPNARPIRRVVSSLHEFNQRTDMYDLLFDYIPKPGHEELNEFFETFQMAWNTVVLACIEALSLNDEQLKEEVDFDYCEAVRQAIRTVRNVVRNVRWFEMGDPLANIIEPQLGYVLRMLETQLQQGLGAAHGVLGIFELRRDAAGG